MAAAIPEQSRHHHHHQPHSEDQTVTILLLGDSGCGKSVFLSRLLLIGPNNPSPLPTDFSTGLLLDDKAQPFTLSIPRNPRRGHPRPPLKLDFYDTSYYGTNGYSSGDRDGSGAYDDNDTRALMTVQGYSQVKPDFVILCYDISSRTSLESVKGRWSKEVGGWFEIERLRSRSRSEGTFHREEYDLDLESGVPDTEDGEGKEAAANRDRDRDRNGDGDTDTDTDISRTATITRKRRPRNGLPVMLLGLKRDLRGRHRLRHHTHNNHSNEDDDDDEDDDGWIEPQEGLRYAQEMRCDLYAECDAVTGSLVRQAFEDIVKTAGKIVSGGDGKGEAGYDDGDDGDDGVGGLSEGPSCAIQ